MKGLLLDENGDLLLKNGSLVIGDIDQQVAELIISAYPGEVKENPILGCNVNSQLNGAANSFWRSNAIKQLKSEGLKVKELTVEDDTIELELE